MIIGQIKNFKMEKEAKRIQSNILKVRNQIFNCPETELLKKSAPNKWSKKEILGHLIDSARFNLNRFTQIANQPELYTYKTYYGDEEVILNQYQSSDLYEIVNLWQAMNRQICKTILHFTQETLAKEFIYKPSLGKDGMKSLHWLITDYVDHMDHHLHQIFETTEPNRKANEFQFSKDSALQKLKDHHSPFINLMKFADLEIEIYQPNKVDHQTPHSRDEIYFISSGSGEFYLEGKIVPFKENDVLFVKAQEEHRFLNFTEDFSTWVVFYGNETTINKD